METGDWKSNIALRNAPNEGTAEKNKYPEQYKYATRKILWKNGNEVS